MKSKQNYKTLFIASLAFIFLFSGSFLIMPLASAWSLDGNNILLIISGLWFWLTAILFVVTFLLANSKRKAVSIDNKDNPGIICFCLNPLAAIADCAFAASLLGLIASFIFSSPIHYIFILVSLSVFSFLMHCVLNGKNFKFLTEQYTRRSLPQKEK